MSGRIIPAPFAAAPIVTSRPPRVRRNAPPLGARSVVQIARPKSAPPPAASAAAAASMPRSVMPRSMRSPIVPVLHTAMCAASMPSRSPARRAIACASSRPGEPVAALAAPALTTTARRAARSRVRLRSTGAEGRALAVSTKADVTGAGGLEDPEVEGPRGLEAARDPRGVVARGGRHRAPLERDEALRRAQPVAAQDRRQGHSSPSVSGSPAIRLRFWTACPAAPLPRLSMTPNTVTRPPRGSTTGHTCA